MLYLPTLSQYSWITDTKLQADYILSYAWLTNYSQSQLYDGKITSIAKIIQENNNDIPGTIAALTKALNIYFSRYFSNVIVQIVQTPATTLSNTSLVELEIYINITDYQGIQFSLGKLFDITNSKINSVRNIINN